MENPPQNKVKVHHITRDDLIRLSAIGNKEELRRRLNQTKFGFEKFLLNREYFDSNKKLNCEVMSSLVEVINNVCILDLEKNRGSLRKFLRMLKGCEQFLFNDVLIFIDFLLRQQNKPVSIVLVTSQYLVILQTLLKNYPCEKICNDVFPVLQNYWNVMKSSKLHNLDNLKAEFDKFKQLVDRYQESPNVTSDDVYEIGNFHNLSIVPKENDIINCEITALPCNIIDGPYENVNHYLGVHFRLTREDMLRCFRECVKNCLNSNEITIARSANHTYENVFVDYPAKYSVRGISYKIKIKSNKNINWAKKEILMPGNMVCLTKNKFHDVIFASICDDLKAKSGNSNECELTIRLEDDLYEDCLSPNVKYLMVEPSAYFECYKHVLTSIKKLSKSNSFPLADWLVYLETDQTSPEYLRDFFRGKKYCLHEKCDVKTEDGSHPCKEFDPLNYEEWPSAEEMNLDDKQHKAFQLALTNKVAVIQGPPGTGKTFIGKKIVKTLLENVPLKPIIICCLTNHALDQFLEGILEFESNVIRLGSQSQSQILESHTVDNIMFTLRQYRDNKYEEDHFLRTNKIAKMSVKQLRTHMPDLLLPETSLGGEFDEELNCLRSVCDELNAYLNILNFCEYYYLEEDSLNSIIGHKEKEELHIRSETHSPNLTLTVMEWLACTRKSDLYEECSKRFAQFKRNNFSHKNKMKLKLWSLDLTERFELFYYWREACLRVTKKNVDEFLEEYKKLKRNGIGNSTDFIRADVLRRAAVVGVTTTGAAKYRELLLSAAPSILIVEEAAEVLESHIIASLLPSIQHLILIGDHKQLRPLPSDHELSEVYNLKISMFERLFTNKAPTSTLVYQHRMKPCIADLLVNEHLYEDLKNYKNVYEYKEIKGVKSSVFFLNHTEPEFENSSSTSSSNEYEAKMVVALTRYLLLQSYTVNQITILATYAAQVNLIHNCLEEAQLEVELKTVDNYQGEENDIIILSFVRNNKSGIIGFLRENNRVCVALSRARMGMFCLGNFTMYAEKSPLWLNIVNKLESHNMIGDKFPLQCNHHGSETFVQTPSEIIEFIQRGCSEPCNVQLPCGHLCTRKCHYSDREHLKYKCTQPCEKYIGENEKCRRLCFERCKRGKKSYIMLDCGHEVRSTNNNEIPVCFGERTAILPCGDVVTVPCSIDITQYKCKALKSVILSCGHKKDIPCFKKDQVNYAICHEPRPLLSPCGHTVDVPCNLNLEGSELLAYCIKSCGKLLNCGHPCLGDCKFCFDFGIHDRCFQNCDLKLNCGHLCQGRCNSPCKPCNQTCSLVCPHVNSKQSKCFNKCYRPCIECHLPCKRRCSHVVCELPCFEPCIVEACSKNCTEVLSCGHNCIGLCGDPCPYLCRVCNEEDIESGNPKLDRYVMLDNCDHVIEVNELNQHIEECLYSGQWPDCPKCTVSIFQSLRFKNQLLTAKEKLFDSWNTEEKISDIYYLLHIMYEDYDLNVPAVFIDVNKKIFHILEQEHPSADIVQVLEHCVRNLSKLVKIYKALTNDNSIQNRFETLLLWIQCHLKCASFQQIIELESSISELENLIGLQ